MVQAYSWHRPFSAGHGAQGPHAPLGDPSWGAATLLVSGVRLGPPAWVCSPYENCGGSFQPRSLLPAKVRGRVKRAWGRQRVRTPRGNRPQPGPAVDPAPQPTRRAHPVSRTAPPSPLPHGQRGITSLPGRPHPSLLGHAPGRAGCLEPSRLDSSETLGIAVEALLQLPKEL